jgi:hypothetical protein
MLSGCENIFCKYSDFNLLFKSEGELSIPSSLSLTSNYLNISLNYIASDVDNI